MLREQVDGLMDELQAHICKIAEDALAVARTGHLYRVQTNNLTSSTGFGVTRDGATVSVSAFDRAPGHDGGDEGCREGREYLRLLLGQEDSTGHITLRMVAGMDYARFVEEMGLDVLRSADAHIALEVARLMARYR